MSHQFLIIDGYNVLRSVGFVKAGIGPGTLQKARQMFFGFLARYLPTEQRQRTTIVFDAKDGPAGGPAEQVVEQMQVLFATEFAEADELIELLIKRHSAPRQLTVVSGDLRLIRAARKRGANGIDSETWFDELRWAAAETPTSTGSPVTPRELAARRSTQRLTTEEVWQWLMEFGAIERVESSDSSGSAKANPWADDTTAKTANNADDNEPGSPPRRHGRRRDPPGSPFPPGYAEDLFTPDDE